MSTFIEVVGAYGRDYKSQKAALADWEANKDFRVTTIGSGSYINKSDAEQYGVTVLIRYSNLTKVFQVKSKRSK